MHSRKEQSKKVQAWLQLIAGSFVGLPPGSKQLHSSEKNWSTNKLKNSISQNTKLHKFICTNATETPGPWLHNTLKHCSVNVP